MEPPLRVDVLAADPQPYLGHSLDALAGRFGGESDAVDGAYRRAVDPVGDEAVLGQHLEHSDLDRPPCAPATEHKGGHLLLLLLLLLFSGFFPVVREVVRRRGIPLPGDPSGPGRRRLPDQEPEREDEEEDGGEGEKGEHDGERGGRSRFGHRDRGYRAPHAAAGPVTPDGHTVAMHETERIRGERQSRHRVPGRQESTGSLVAGRGASGPVVGAPSGWSARWQPLAGADLLDRLRVTGRARPPVDPALASTLRAFLERGIDDLVTAMSVQGRVVTRDRLTRALACPLHRMPDRSSHRSFSLPLASGALMGALFRQVVTSGTIGDALTEGLEALSLDEYQAPLVGWIGQLAPAERSELRSEVERQADGLLRRWPALDPAWLPRTRETLRAPLAGGRVELVSRVDLAIGRPTRGEASVALVEVTSGERRPGHHDDRLLDALVETLRRPVPPFVVATYFTRTGEIDVDPVTPERLAGAARRCLAGMRAMAAPDLGESSSPDSHPYCAGCAGLPLPVIPVPTADASVTPVTAARPSVGDGVLPFPQDRAA